ncbi:redoxin domain-containing protein [Paenibacillus sp. 5J-6]|uniref:Redoxin domain-containing protein n=1 Tax=Paenibacillus silvestris TaxID=2606219 RepID=A0A6L8UTY6_9BACL|nr:redoxin domain-containing protein [Paenibacillus silvestris]MZQ80590.1 redoxin domain-containing protein [Paenibacillus silvestris]
MENFTFYSTILIWLILIPVIYFIVLIIRQMNVIYLYAMSNSGIPVGVEIPTFEEKSMLTKSNITNTAFQDKPTLIAFVSPSCKRCKALLADWNEAYDLYHDKYNFLLIGYGKEEQFNKIVQNYKIKSEFIVSKSLFEKLKSKLVAFAYFIDANGVVRRKGLCENMQEIKSLIG